MLCEKCGKELPADSESCPLCDETIGAEAESVEKKTPYHKTTQGRLTALVIVLVIVVTVGVVIGLAYQATHKTLHTTVSVLDGVQLEIDNHESFDWTNVRLTLNQSYTLTTSRMDAKSTYTVGLGQFTKKDGTRFNPFTVKPLKLKIACDQGSWSVELE
jgi:uncharacterized membrane protein YvbJ